MVAEHGSVSNDSDGDYDDDDELDEVFSVGTTFVDAVAADWLSQKVSRGVHIRSFSDVDNSPASLLAFSGINNVHALYDFLLNYRFLLTSLSSVDIPVLWSPVPFQNSALSSPDVCPWLHFLSI
ncbi:hypothetical protein JHK82_050437 [Glycine max]|nr:hypothetical protein JHK86_050284 [Glycine max]KAG4936158.1 hypothetical protein JHK85_051077 [Glycine max]KAG5091659.1 hypothetical protein JHK82_050437 [Glycine max]KAG5094757.1 hypothetical protein JHK84_050345 [Glycine max]